MEGITKRIWSCFLQLCVANAMLVDGKNKRRSNQGSKIYCRPRKKGGYGSFSASHVEAQILAASSRINTDLGRSIIVGLQDFILTYLQKSSRDSSTVEELLSEGLLAVLPLLLASRYYYTVWK